MDFAPHESIILFWICIKNHNTTQYGGAYFYYSHPISSYLTRQMVWRIFSPKNLLFKKMWFKLTFRRQYLLRQRELFFIKLYIFVQITENDKTWENKWYLLNHLNIYFLNSSLHSKFLHKIMMIFFCLLSKHCASPRKLQFISIYFSLICITKYTNQFVIFYKVDKFNLFLSKLKKKSWNL